MTTVLKRGRAGLAFLAASLFAVGVVLTGGVEPAAAATDPSTILRNAYNSTLGEAIPIRQGGYNVAGDYGYGYTKMVKRHNVTDLDGINHVFRSPHLGQATSGILLWAYAYKFVNGQPVEKQEMQAVFNPEQHTSYYGYHVGGGVVGGITAFCVGKNSARTG